MGSGKTTVGRKLAQALGRPFQDLDHYLEEKENKTVATLFELRGEDYFRQIEKEGLRALAQQPRPHVISLGGGTVMSDENFSVIRQSGCLVYLQLSPAALFSRLRFSARSRPLLRGLTEEAMKEKITSLLQQREPRYLQADLVVDGLDLEAVTLKNRLIEKQLL
jgi:shikimate kinase